MTRPAQQANRRRRRSRNDRCDTCSARIFFDGIAVICVNDGIQEEFGSIEAAKEKGWLVYPAPHPDNPTIYSGMCPECDRDSGVTA